MTDTYIQFNMADAQAEATRKLGSTLQAATKALTDAGHSVEPSGDIPGLYRINGGAELTVGQVVDVARQNGLL